jgi:(p)ppGpp synthase/HD superfamily hydrolase
MSYSAALDRALVFSASAHRNQARKGTDIPYIIHPVHVAMILLRHDFPEEVILAAVLHDVVEDTDKTVEDIAAHFGENVARLVDAVSERKTHGGQKLPWRKRKEAQLERLEHADRDIAALKAADALHNLRSTLADFDRVGHEVWQRFRGSSGDHHWYYASLVKLTQSKLGDHSLVQELSRALAELSETLHAS